MKISKKFLVVVFVFVFIFSLSGLIKAKAATKINLGSADSFAVLAGSAITNVPPAVITGDVGLSPTTGAAIAVTAAEVTGTIYAVDAFGPVGSSNNPGFLTLAKNDLTAAYIDAAGQTPVTVGTELGGTTKNAGVYNSAAGDFQITGTLTLDGQGNPNSIFIFQTTSTLVTAVSSQVTLINGAQACNVFWKVGSSATLGGLSDFKGNILALTSITDDGGSTINGRLLARNAAVALNDTTITKPTCAATPSSTAATINVVKLVINDNGGIKTVSDFPLFVNGTSVASGVTNTFPITGGVYSVTETSNNQYTRTFSGDCDINGQLNLNHGQNKVCVVTNNDIGAPVIVAPVPPLIDVLKVPSPLSLPFGPGSVKYTYTLRNVGTVPVTDITMVGDSCSPIVLNSGDLNNDSKLDLNEMWSYSCTTTLTETHTNTVVATGWANGISAVDIANATVVVGKPIVPPLIHVTKIPSPLTLRVGGGAVTYTYTVTNPGTEPLSNVGINDDKCFGLPSVVSGNSGDLNKNNLLEKNETWSFTCKSNLTKTTTNTVTAQGAANGLIATDFAVATVLVATPSLPKTGFPSAPWNMVIILLSGLFILVSVSFVIVLKKHNKS